MTKDKETKAQRRRRLAKVFQEHLALVESGEGEPLGGLPADMTDDEFEDFLHEHYQKVLAKKPKLREHRVKIGLTIDAGSLVRIRDGVAVPDTGSPELKKDRIAAAEADFKPGDIAIVDSASRIWPLKGPRIPHRWTDPNPFYGIDGNPLVEDLPYSHEVVETILNGTFKPAFFAQQFLPGTLFCNYPQLVEEARKRRGRRKADEAVEQANKVDDDWIDHLQKQEREERVLLCSGVAATLNTPTSPRRRSCARSPTPVT